MHVFLFSGDTDDIRVKGWEHLAADRSAWRLASHNGAQDFEERRLFQLKATVPARHQSPSQEREDGQPSCCRSLAVRCVDASVHRSLVCGHTKGATDVVVASRRTTMMMTMMMMMMMMMMETQVGGGLVVVVFSCCFYSHAHQTAVCSHAPDTPCPCGLFSVVVSRLMGLVLQSFLLWYRRLDLHLKALPHRWHRVVLCCLWTPCTCDFMQATLENVLEHPSTEHRTWHLSACSTLMCLPNSTRFLNRSPHTGQAYLPLATCEVA